MRLPCGEIFARKVAGWKQSWMFVKENLYNSRGVSLEVAMTNFFSDKIDRVVTLCTWKSFSAEEALRSVD